MPHTWYAARVLISHAIYIFVTIPHYRFHLYFFLLVAVLHQNQTTLTWQTRTENVKKKSHRPCSSQSLPYKASKPKFFRTQSPRITMATTCCATYASSGWYRYPKSSAHPAHAHSWATIRKDRFLHRWRSAAKSHSRSPLPPLYK
jgi:hypothetical protein